MLFLLLVPLDSGALAIMTYAILNMSKSLELKKY